MRWGFETLLAAAAVLWTPAGTLNIESDGGDHQGHGASKNQECGNLGLLQTGTRHTVAPTPRHSHPDSFAASTSIVTTLPTSIHPLQDSSNRQDIHPVLVSFKSILAYLSASGLLQPDIGNNQPELSHAQQLVNQIHEGCKTHAESWCGSTVRFEVHRIAMAFASLVLDFILVSGWICQVHSPQPFAQAQRTSYLLAAHIVVGIVEAVLLVAIFCFPGVQRPSLLRGLLAFELAFAFTVSAVTVELRSSKNKETRLVGTGYLLLASVKLVVAALMIASPTSVDLLWAQFFAHHTAPWALAFVGIFQRAGLFAEHRSAVATVAALLVVLPCGLGTCSGGALVALSIAILLYSFGPGRKKDKAVPWFSQSHDHRHAMILDGDTTPILDVPQQEHGEDADLARNSDPIHTDAHLYAEIAAQEAHAEAAEADFDREVSLATMAHSKQAILEDELRVEKSKGRRAEVALAQLAAEHTKLVSVREELEFERNRGQQTDTALALRAEALGQEITRLQSDLEAAEAAQELTTAQLQISQGNCLMAAEEVKRLKSTLAQAVTEETRTEASKNQALEELAFAQQRLTSEIWQQDATDVVKVALIKSEATAQKALQEYEVATTKALQHSTECARLRNSLASVEAEVSSSKGSITELKRLLTDEAKAADGATRREVMVAEDMARLSVDMERLSSVEAYLRRELDEEKSQKQFKPMTISAATQAGSRAELDRQTEELRAAERLTVQRTEELRAAKQQTARQTDELRLSQLATSSVYAEWQNAEAFLAASQGLAEGLEAQNAQLRSQVGTQLLQATDEHQQIQHLRAQVKTLEEELDVKEEQLIRAEPLVVFKGRGSLPVDPGVGDPGVGGVASALAGAAARSPKHVKGRADPRSSSTSPTRPSQGLQSPQKGAMSETNLQPAFPVSPTRSLSPMEARQSPQKNVQWLPPGRAQSLLVGAQQWQSMPTTTLPSSSQSMPSSALQFQSMPELRPVHQSSASAMSSSSQMERPRSVQSLPVGSKRADLQHFASSK